MTESEKSRRSFPFCPYSSAGQKTGCRLTSVLPGKGSLSGLNDDALFQTCYSSGPRICPAAPSVQNRCTFSFFRRFSTGRYGGSAFRIEDGPHHFSLTMYRNGSCERIYFTGISFPVTSGSHFSIYIIPASSTLKCPGSRITL